MGVPLRTASDLYRSFERVLREAGVPRKYVSRRQHRAVPARPRVGDVYKLKCMSASRKCPEHNGSGHHDCHRAVRSMRVDTGADVSLGHMELEPHLINPKDSNTVIQVAKDGVTMCTSKEGTFPAYAINTPSYEGIDEATPIDVGMITVPNLHEGLFALEEYYRDKGYDIHLRQPHNGWSGMEKGDHKIPFRYDYANGGFHMDYIPRAHAARNAKYSTSTRGSKMQRMRDSALLKHAFSCRTENYSEANVALLRYNTYNRVVAAHVGKRCDRSPMVSQVIHAYGDELQAPDASKRDHNLTAIWAHHPDDREVRGAKEDLRTKKRKQSRKEFHEDHGHIGGDCPDCEICRMAKGNMRRIMKNYNKVREHRMRRSWVMATITMSGRSEEGYKYLIVLRDRASAFIQLLLLCRCCSMQAHHQG